MSIKNVHPLRASTFSLYTSKPELTYTDTAQLYATAGGDIFLLKEGDRQRYVAYEFDLIEAFAGENQKIEIPLINRKRNAIKGLKISYVLSNEFGYVLNKNDVINSTVIYNATIVANCVSVDIAELLANCDIDNNCAITFIVSADISQADGIAVFVAERNLENVRINLEAMDMATFGMRPGAEESEIEEPSEVELFIVEQYDAWKEEILDTELTVRDYEKYNVTANDSINFVMRNAPVKMELPVELPAVETTAVTYNQYGSVINEETRQEATGYFYTKVINGSYRVIDPEGYVHTIKNVMFPLPTLNTPNAIQIKEDTIEQYDTEDWKNATAEVLTNAEFNCYEQYYNLITEGKFTYDNLNCISKFPILDSWAREFDLKGLERAKLCNILHPKFKDRAHFKVKQILVKEPQHANNVVAYTLDNEPYFDKDDLINCLYTNDEKLAYRKEAAEVWLKCRLDSAYASVADVTDELCAEFISFEFYIYSKFINAEIRALDENHMIFSPAMQWYKFSAARGFLGENDNFFKVINKYYDALAITHYSTYDVLNEGIDDLKLDIPVFLNEFSIKSLDRLEYVDAMAGPCVGNQADRAKYFEHVATQCLKNKNCIGYTWYQYSDIVNPAGVINRGIVDTNGDVYAELYASMKKINSNAETLQN